MLIAKAQTITVKRETMEGQAKDALNPIPPDEIDNFTQKLKHIRREQVDMIHFIGTHRQELETHQANLKAFEDLHREEFLRYFNEIKEKLTHQYAEYYLRNVIPEALADMGHKERLLCAKKYCNETKSGSQF